VFATTTLRQAGGADLLLARGEHGAGRAYAGSRRQLGQDLLAPQAPDGLGFVGQGHVGQ